MCLRLCLDPLGLRGSGSGLQRHGGQLEGGGGVGGHAHHLAHTDALSGQASLVSHRVVGSRRLDEKNLI